MSDRTAKKDDLEHMELALRRRLAEAEDTLEAIRAGEVDAVVVNGPAGQQVYTLESPEQPFRIFVEQMQEGALTLNADGTIVYCNRFFADMVGCPLEQVRGKPMLHFVAAADVDKFLGLFDAAANQAIRRECHLLGTTGAVLPAQLAINRLPAEDRPMFGMVITDLTERERAKQLEVAITARSQEHQALEELTLLDPLTGIANRRYLERFAGREWRWEARNRHPVALVMADVDYFKAYNDGYGHPQGDECLRQVAGALREFLRRPADTLVRYGGGEFVALLPETELMAAQEIAEQMRQAVEERRLPHSASPFERVTVSFGVAALMAHEALFSDLVEAADEALYRAKKQGRNRVEAKE